MRKPKDEIEKSLVGRYLSWKVTNVLQLRTLAKIRP